MSLFTRQRRTLLLVATAAAIIAVPSVSYAQFGKNLSAAAPTPVQHPEQVQPEAQQIAPVQHPAQVQPAAQQAESLPQTAPAQIAPPKKPKIAGYVSGAEDSSLNKAMAARLIIALDNSGRYQAAENYKDFFDRAAKTQKGGGAHHINTKQLKKLGEQFGADYVFAAEITTVFGEKQVSAHILKVDAIGIAAIGVADIPLKTLADVAAAAEQTVSAMFKKVPRSDFGKLGDARDGRTYKTVNIGGKTWMAENLNYKTESGSWCYYGNDDSSNCDKYGGKLYDWNTAMKVCPAGWHLPSREEWKNMIIEAGDSSAAGKKLKSANGWKTGSGTDHYGFAALPGGYRTNTGSGFDNAGNGGNWWTSTENSPYAYSVRISYDDSVDEIYNHKEYGFSVRCMQD
jgi:uncharacterized protein (TIGR02145 family)